MGTHPDTGNHPAMPHPQRVFSRSRAMLRMLGFTDTEALAVIADVARTARFRLWGTGYGRDTWLSQIVNLAEDRLATRQPPNTDNTGEDYGDGPGRPASGAEKDQHRAP